MTNKPTTMIDIYEAAGGIVNEDRSTVTMSNGMPMKSFDIKLRVYPIGYEMDSDGERVVLGVVLHDEVAFEKTPIGTKVRDISFTEELKNACFSSQYYQDRNEGLMNDYQSAITRNSTIAELQEALGYVNSLIEGLKKPQNERHSEYFNQGGTPWELEDGYGNHLLLDLMVKKATIVSALVDLGAF
jgi:hypothetical protein